MTKRLDAGDFFRLVGWSIRFHWAHTPVQRRRARARVVMILRRRLSTLSLSTLTPDATEFGVAQALWLGATLNARSIVRSVIMRRRFRLVRSMLWLVGRGIATGILAAYLVWARLSHDWYWQQTPGTIG